MRRFTFMPERNARTADTIEITNVPIPRDNKILSEPNTSMGRIGTAAPTRYENATVLPLANIFSSFETVSLLLRNYTFAASSSRTSFCDPRATYAPAPMEMAPATATVVLATKMEDVAVNAA